MSFFILVSSCFWIDTFRSLALLINIFKAPLGYLSRLWSFPSSPFTFTMDSQPSPKPSFFTVFSGVPHSLSCGRFSHACHSTGGPSGKDAALPRLHLQAIRPQEVRYPRLHKYFHGQKVWVDGWGRVTLLERSLGVSGYRYYACVGRRSRVVGWVRVPISATLQGQGGEGGGPQN